MTATDELRKLLDERGAKTYHEQNYITWRDANDYQCFAFETYERPGLLRVHCNLTPEQAIAATLGRRGCKLRDCDGSFSAVNRPVWLCDCGAFMTQYTDATTYHKPNYCPNCGRKVVGE